MLGDLDNDSQVTLTDGVTSLQVTAGTHLPRRFSRRVDVNGDGFVGLEDTIYILQKIADTE